MTRALFLAGLLATVFTAACAGPSNPTETRPADRHLVDDPSVRDETGRVQMVVEIPAGSCDKWEVDKTSGQLRWEQRDGRPRVVDYLGYPGNYGMVPRTLLPTSEGGDGDPLDVLLLGPAVARGSIVPCRLIGALVLLDGGEQDDKLIAVPGTGPFSRVRDIEGLDRDYPGVSEIVELWFRHYKGPGRMESRGFRSAEEADRLLEQAAASYLAAR